LRGGAHTVLEENIEVAEAHFAWPQTTRAKIDTLKP